VQAQATLVSQLIIGIAATVPFARRRTLTTGTFALTFWLAGLLTISAQPIQVTSTRAVALISGSPHALALADLIIVAWGCCGCLLYVIHTSASAPRSDELVGLKRRATLVLLGHGITLALLWALLPRAATNSTILEQGVWFPAAPTMAPAALAYGILGKLYMLAMMTWAGVGLLFIARRLTHPVMRVGALLGACFATAMFAQSVAVTVAQAHGVNFFATAVGRAEMQLWLGVGFVTPLATFGLVGLLNRWRLFWLARDLRAFSRYLIEIILLHQPERRPDLIGWVKRLVPYEDTLLTPDGQSLTSSRSHGMLHAPRHSTAVLLLWIKATVFVPTGGVDGLTALVRDVLETVFPLPGEAMLLAAIWLWRQPPQTLRHMRERDVAKLLLAATIIGADEGLFEPLPMAHPAPITETIAAERNRADWRTWGIPPGAAFFSSVWWILQHRQQQPVPVHESATATPDIARGLFMVRELLRLATAEERSLLLDQWIATVEQVGRSPGEQHREGDGSEPDSASAAVTETEQRTGTGDPLARWWRPPNAAADGHFAA
jgi:hypothetical protein